MDRQGRKFRIGQHYAQLSTPHGRATTTRRTSIDYFTFRNDECCFVDILSVSASIQMDVSGAIGRRMNEMKD